MMHLLLIVSLATSVPATPADSLDACGLYTRNEVAKFAGEAARRPRTFTVNPATHASCTTATSTGQWTVKVYIERASSKEVLRMSLKALKGVAKGQTSQALKPVSGLGDEAYWGQVRSDERTVPRGRGNDNGQHPDLGKSARRGHDGKNSSNR